jgi:hypothetical protein
MRTEAVETTGRVRQVAVPPDVPALTTLAHVDYADAFLVQTEQAQARTAEQWVRAMFGTAPPGRRRALRGGWTALGFKLGPAESDRFLLGWELRRTTPDHVLLAADSRIGMPAELYLQRREDALLFGTFVQHSNPIARVVWAVTEPRHRPVVRSVLEQAIRRVDP